jgi:hypothetical protein
MSKDNPSSRRRGYAALITIFVTAAAAVFAIPVLAVNATGAFELDGNAVTSHSGTGAPDDWDRVCHQVLGTDCSTTTNTNGATAVEFASQTASGGTTFTGGGSKDPIDVSSWAWNQAAGGLPGKDILLNGFAARYSLPPNPATCPSTTSTCNVLFFGMDRFDNSGDAQNGFWFFQNAVGLGSVKSGGGQNFSGVHRNGDLLVVSDFSIGGTISTISVYIWNSACTAAGKPTASCADSNLQLLQTSNAANCATSSATAAFCGIVNPSAGTTSPWSFTDKKGNTSFDQGEMYEGGINLSAFGLGGECFASTLAESRSSTSTSAVLKSFVLGGFGACGSQVKTHPQDSSGNDITSISIGTGSAQPQVMDQAVVNVTGTNTFGGSVTFHLCGPADLVSQPTCISGGTLVGSAKAVSPPSPSTVTSDLATVTSVGSYCWRGDYSGDASVGVPAASDSGTTECFTVTPVPTTLATSAGAGPVLLGNPINDTATLSGTANRPGTPVINPTTAGGPAGGTITFTAFGPGNCTSVAFTTTVNVSGDGTYGPVSFTPTAAGAYHWAATYSGDSPNTLASTHNLDCSDPNEDVVVQQLFTTTVTTPDAGSGVSLSNVPFNTSVVDHAVVQGAALGGSPSGTVTFFICNPSQVSGGVCATGGSQVGSPVNVTPGPGANQSSATPDAVSANIVGVWCFRGVFTSATVGYTGSSDASADECFTVTDTTSASSAQTWLPNDSATITSGGSPLDGTVTFTLYAGGTCTGTVLYTEPGQAISGSGPLTVHTNNSTVKVSTSQTVSWQIVYTPNSPFVTGTTTCVETTSISISNG